MRAGESASLKLKLQNNDLPPAPVALGADGVPQGWKATILGGGVPVTAAMPATNESVNLTLRVDIPANAGAGTREITLHAKTPYASASLPIDLTIGQDLPAQLGIKAKLPSLRGTPTTSFEYQFTVTNQSDKDVVVKLAAAAPQGFQTTFTEAYGTQELSSIPIEAGKDKDLKIKVTPPPAVAAGDYPVAVQASADGAAAETKVDMQITGQAKLRLTGDGDRLSARPRPARPRPSPSSSAMTAARRRATSRSPSSPPSDWKVEFQPATIPQLAPKQKVNVQALLTPSSKAVAGDYMTTFRANAEGGSDSTSADFRITVATSTLWGIVGVVLIAIALLVAVGAVARFGRR